jgi:hypothetical protein
MSKVILLTIVLGLILGLLASCSGGVSQEVSNKTSGNLATAQAEIQSLQTELHAVQSQLKDKTIELYTYRTQLTDAQAKIQSYQNVFPLREFKSLSELQGFLNFNAKLWQLDLLKMQQGKQFASIDFARALQVAANKSGYIISVQIDKATGTVFNTAFIDNIIYAIEPQYSFAPSGMATNKVWVYQE